MMRTRLKTARCSAVLFAALLCLLRTSQCTADLSRQEIREGWIQLFDGETLFGWETHGDCKWRAEAGTLFCDEGKDGWLGTTTEFADFVLRLEYRISGNGNSGVFFRAHGDIPWETGYEMQIWDKDEKYPTGSIYGVAAARHPAGKLVTEVEKWQKVEIRAEGDQISVSLNGTKVLDARDPKHGRGVIGLQYHYPGMKIEARHIRLKPLGLQPIPVDENLSEWQIIPGRKSVFNVLDGGVLNIQNGNGQIETKGLWQDFVFQLDVISNGTHLNSGVFFRGDPGRFWSGYESQIRNQWQGDDRTDPVDYGTGGIYNRQPARKVIPSDFDENARKAGGKAEDFWFTKTIIAHGNHMTVWVDGYQVSDYVDPRPVGMNARQECRLASGTISLQGHDPTTDLSFRNLRIAEYPKQSDLPPAPDVK